MRAAINMVHSRRMRSTHVITLVAVCLTCLLWCKVDTPDHEFAFSGWWQEWEYLRSGGTRISGWRFTHTAWVRLQAIIRALVFPVVFYRILTADSARMRLLAERVRSPSRALAVVFCSLWPKQGDYLGYGVLWTLLFCRCGLGLGEMLSSEEYTLNRVVQLLAPLPGIVAGHFYFRSSRHFWGFVTLSPFKPTKIRAASDADLWAATASPVTPVARRSSPHDVFVSVDWVKYGGDTNGNAQPATAAAEAAAAVDAMADPNAWFVDYQTHTALASPSRRHSRAAFFADTFLGRRRGRSASVRGSSTPGCVMRTPPLRPHPDVHRRSMSADGPDADMVSPLPPPGLARRVSDSGEALLDPDMDLFGNTEPSAGSAGIASPTAHGHRHSLTAVDSARRLSIQVPGGGGNSDWRSGSSAASGGSTKSSGSSRSLRRRRGSRPGPRRATVAGSVEPPEHAANGAAGGRSGRRAATAARSPPPSVRRVKDANGRVVGLRKASSLLDRAVTARGMLGLALAAGVLSSVDAFCQYLGHPKVYASWAARQLVIGRWRDTVLALYLAPVQVATGIMIVCVGLWLAGYGVRAALERLALGWLSYFSFLAMHRWCDIIFAVAVGIVYRGHQEEALALISRVGASVVDPSEYQRLLRKIKASNKAMKHLLWYICVNGAAYFVADSYSRFWGDHTEDVADVFAWVGFGARHILSVLPPAVLLWNVACLNEATHDKMIDRWMVMFLHYHQLTRLVEYRQQQADARALADGDGPAPRYRLCFERYECTDFMDFVKGYRRGYWDFMSWVSKKAFYTWIFVALFTTVQANWSAALQHVQHVISQQGAAVTFVGMSTLV